MKILFVVVALAACSPASAARHVETAPQCTVVKDGQQLAQRRCQTRCYYLGNTQYCDTHCN